MNLFKQESMITETLNRQKIALVASRIYLTVLAFSMVVLALYNCLQQVVTHVSIQTSSIIMFEKMHAKHPSSLSCPCEHISIPYSTFISLRLTYHQVFEFRTDFSEYFEF